MKKIFFTRGIAVASLMFGLAVVPALFAEEKKEDKKVEAPKLKSVFKDKALEEDPFLVDLKGRQPAAEEEAPPQGLNDKKRGLGRRKTR